MQVIRLDDGNLVMDTARLKTEPEDLSLREEAGVVRFRTHFIANHIFCARPPKLKVYMNI